MGYWGTGVYQNDIACDFIIDVVAEAYDNAKYIDEFIVVMDLIDRTDTYVPSFVAKTCIDILDKEIERISDWQEESQQSRLELLSKLKSRIETLKMDED